MVLLETFFSPSVQQHFTDFLHGGLQVPQSTEHPHQWHDKAFHGSRPVELLSQIASVHTLQPKAAKASSRHVDFLFTPGAPTALIGKPPTRTMAPFLIEPKAGKPRLAMMPGWVSSLNPFSLVTQEEEEQEDPETGWFKTIPRGLRFFLCTDLISMLILAASRHATCDVPLKLWLVGGILLGYPTSCIVDSFTKRRKCCRVYRFTALQLRCGADAAEAQLDSIQLRGRFGLEIPQATVSQQHSGAVWLLNLDKPERVSAYTLVTHRSASPDLDPVMWMFEGSVDGIHWELLDEYGDTSIPTARGSESVLMDNLADEEEVNDTFRSGFFLEQAFNIGAFAWLVTGTSWVSAGTDTCVDSAPLLWYSCYMMVVAVWSLTGTMAMVLIISAVAMIALGTKTS